MQDPGGACNGPGYLDCWNTYWDWTKTDDFKTHMRRSSTPTDFLDDNYLSTDLRVPVTLLQTNACSPLATQRDARQHLGQFLVGGYKDLPSVGEITVYNPFNGAPQQVSNAGRRARLHAAAVADQPVVDGALSAQQLGRRASTRALGRGAHELFEDPIEQMLWPDKREKDAVMGDLGVRRDRPYDRGKLAARCRTDICRTRWSRRRDR